MLKVAMFDKCRSTSGVELIHKITALVNKLQHPIQKFALLATLDRQVEQAKVDLEYFADRMPAHVTDAAWKTYHKLDDRYHVLNKSMAILANG